MELAVDEDEFPGRVKRVTNKLFDECDQNKDGALDKDEWALLCARQEDLSTILSYEDKQQFEDFTAADANGDGLVSLDEYKLHCEKHTRYMLKTWCREMLISQIGEE